MPDYRKGSHAIYDILYHFVRLTKYRYLVLRGAVAKRARQLSQQSLLSRDIKMMKGQVSKDDVHFLVSFPAQIDFILSELQPFFGVGFGLLGRIPPLFEVFETLGYGFQGGFLRLDVFRKRIQRRFRQQ